MSHLGRRLGWVGGVWGGCLWVLLIADFGVSGWGGGGWGGVHICLNPDTLIGRHGDIMRL